MAQCETGVPRREETIDITAKGLFLPASSALVSACILLAARGISLVFLRRWAHTTGSTTGDIIISSLKTPSLFWCIAIGLHIGAEVSDLPQRYVFYFSKAISILVILSATVAAANLAGKIFRNYVGQTTLSLPATGLAYGTVKGAILVTGFLITLSVLGISIAPLVTALGVGGLAVALALQDTLSNLFAGMHILIEKSLRVGDFVKLETGQEGYIEDITWRTTRIRMLPNNTVVIPNSKFSQSVVTNYSLPDKRMSFSMPVAVSYSADPERVEGILVEEARNSVSQIPGLLGEPEPSVQLIPGFGESSLNFTLTCQVREFTDQYPVQHELRKRILRRFRAEGIEIPYPQRTVHLRDER